MTPEAISPYTLVVVVNHYSNWIDYYYYYQLNCLDELDISVLQYYKPLHGPTNNNAEQLIEDTFYLIQLTRHKSLCMPGAFCIVTSFERIVDTYIIPTKSLKHELHVNTFVHTHVDTYMRWVGAIKPQTIDRRGEQHG